MKVQLDTTNKVIKLESSINLGEFVKKIKKLLPEDWEKFTLETNTTISYQPTPIYITEYPAVPNYPWYTTICQTDSGLLNRNDTLPKASYELKEGIFNLDLS